MSGPLHMMPLADVQALVGLHLDHVRNDPRQLHPWLSIAEYLKDAERWQYVMNNCFHDDLRGILVSGPPEEFKKTVDRLRGAK